MPYYRAGDYYRGDYYRGNYAAGGIFGSIGKFVGNVAKGVLKATPLGQAINIVAPKLLNSGPGQGAVSQLAPQIIPVVPEPGISGFVHRLVPGGSTGLIVDPAMGGRPGRRPGDTGRIGHFKKDGTWTNRARPRMNAGNMKALRRANRRARSFLRAARSAVRYFTPRAPKGKAYVSFKKKR